MAVSINGSGTIGGVSDFSSSNIALTDPEITGGIYLGGTGSANYLDDYETGAFTPTLRASLGGGDYSLTNEALAYEKIGSLVHVSGRVSIAAKNGTCNGRLILTLPFVVLASSISKCPATIFANRSSLDTGISLVATSENGSAELNIYRGDTVTASSANNNNGIFNGDEQIWVNLTYRTDS